MLKVSSRWPNGSRPRMRFSVSSTRRDLRNFPERATTFGDYRYNDRLNDYSLNGIMRRREGDEALLKRLEALATVDFPDQDQLSHDPLIRILKQRIADFDLKESEMPINQPNGIHTSLANLPLAAARFGEAL